MLFFLTTAFADGYFLGEGGAGITTHVRPERPEIFFSGFSCNLGIAGSVIFPREDISARFLHSRTDLDVGMTHSVSGIQNDVVIELRQDIHAGIQYKRFIPANVAIKDMFVRFDHKGVYSRGLYGLGVMIPKEYLRKGDGQAANISLSMGARIRPELSKNLFAVQPEIYVMHNHYSLRMNVLQTIGSRDSQERSVSGMFLYRFIQRMQIGFRWFYTDIFDAPSGRQSTEQEFIFFVTI